MIKGTIKDYTITTLEDLINYISDISIHSVKRSTNQFRSQFTKQTLWEIVKYLYS